jgi:GR25 family glycosyltransferase involved in LPS biosynthesis
MSFSVSNFNENLNIVKTLIERGDYKIAYNLCKNMLSAKYTDDKYIFDILSEQAKCESIDDKCYCGYNNKTIQKYIKVFTENKSRGITLNSVTITTTTCKRLDLFIQTVNSFLECCLDIDKYVYEWIVIDDNSSEEDREYMKTQYPFITYIYKTPDQKGHPRSMNMLLDVIKTPYILNLEDDWRFFVKDNYITKCLQVLDENPNYGQCLLNRSYGEDLGSVARIGGGYRRYTKDGVLYYIHEYLIDKALQNCISRLNGKTHCIYWPHYSLRVGLTRTSVYAKLGKYNEKAAHFEQDYAYKYYLNGRYLTTYLESIYCTHIGRRTYERDSDKLNAYDLNEEKQFGQTPKNIQKKSTDINKISPVIDKNGTPGGRNDNEQNNPLPPIDPKSLPMINTKIYVLNLTRRPDRIKRFREMNINELSQFHVFNAIDGMSLKPTHKIQKLFQHNDYKYRRGIVGCALSHVAMWNELLKSKTLDSLIVLEDDAEVAPNFMKKVLHCINTSPEADIIFFGHHPYPKYKREEDFNKEVIPITEKWTREKCVRESMGGTTGYYITRRGATNMFNYIREESIRNGIDWVMFKTADINNIYYCSPFIAFADCYQNNVGKVDTDIQSVYDGTGYEDTKKWIKDEIESLYNLYQQTGINTENTTDELFNEFSKDSQSIIKVMNKYPDNKRDILNNIIICRDNIEEVQKRLKYFPVKFYTVNEYLITIPENRLNENILKEKTFDGFINTYLPVDL